jgi:hypothetical protein
MSEGFEMELLMNAARFVPANEPVSDEANWGIYPKTKSVGRTLFLQHTSN